MPNLFGHSIDVSTKEPGVGQYSVLVEGLHAGPGHQRRSGLVEGNMTVGSNSSWTTERKKEGSLAHVSVAMYHRRRTKTEEKADLVASVWGKEFIQFLAALPVLPRKIYNKRMNCRRII